MNKTNDLINSHYEELYHYGVKGMKWGIRKYQNYDGSYTRKGVERFRKAESDYDSAKANSDKIREAYKSGNATKEQYKNAKREVKSAKRKMNDSYKRLKTDKMADEGKKLYASGKTITGNTNKNAIVGLGIAGGMLAASKIIRSSIGDQRIATISEAAISAGGLAVSAIMSGKAISDNKKLRAYYGH